MIILIKAILFDVGGVLSIEIDKTIHKDLSKLLVDEVNWKNVQKRIKPYEQKFDIGLISVNYYYRLVAKDLGIDSNKVKSIYLDSINNKAHLNKKAIQIAKKMKEKGYKIGILSNTNKIFGEIHKRRGDYALFSPVILSYKVGHRKPEKKIYQIALKKLKVKPNECIFIDNKENKLLPARKLGIKTIHFKSADQLERKLNKML